MKRFSLLAALIVALVYSNLSAQTKIDLQPSDSILSILQRNTGQTVELRLKSGEKIGGKVEKIADKLTRLSFAADWCRVLRRCRRYSGRVRCRYSKKQIAASIF